MWYGGGLILTASLLPLKSKTVPEFARMFMDEYNFWRLNEYELGRNYFPLFDWFRYTMEVVLDAILQICAIVKSVSSFGWPIHIPFSIIKKKKKKKKEIHNCIPKTILDCTAYSGNEGC